ncbi:MAG: GTP 3',8-cyclase MoaA [FCB group bacterium]|jgi:cyclic pyranopterin phosphate synthase|nr:GTP 3',8-cyclase MoaA [FCB group bacterium]
MADTSGLPDSLGRPMRDLRISVIDKCNLRCTYCMPAEVYPEHYAFLNPQERLSFDEIVRLATLFVGLGVQKIRLTGGEPLLRRDLHTLVARLAPLEGVVDLALTTNGLRLAAQAEALKTAGLHRVTVSLDSLDDEVFGRMNGKGQGVRPVLAGIAKAEEVGLSPIKLNVVVQRGTNDHLLMDLVEHFRGTGHVPRFIEYMDVGNRNGWEPTVVVPSRELLHRIHERYPVRPLEANYTGEVAERYAFLDGGGEIGFISSVSQPFCGTCARARLSPDGKLFTCLFAREGFDLREPMRAGATDEQLCAMIVHVWKARSDRYSEIRGALRAGGVPPQKIEMYQIGG